MGDMIARYELRRLIGRGALASVYLAMDPLLGRQVAVKVVPLNAGADTASSDYVAKRIEREAFAAGKLEHPSIVTTYEAGRENDSAYLVMQYVDGRTLEDILSNGDAFSRDQVVRILLDISSALDVCAPARYRSSRYQAVEHHTGVGIRPADVDGLRRCPQSAFRAELRHAEPSLERLNSWLRSRLKIVRSTGAPINSRLQLSPTKC